MAKQRSTNRRRAGFTTVEAVCVGLIAAVLVAIAVPLCLTLARRAQLRRNMVNVATLHSDALAEIQIQLDEPDSTTPDSRRVNEGLGAGAGWVALAQVDAYNNFAETRLFVVDDISDYMTGIAPGKAAAPVSVSSGGAFYPQPDEEKVWSPFAGISPTTGGARAYTVQVALDAADVDLVQLGPAAKGEG